MLFCKQLPFVKIVTQNDSIYGEFGRTYYYTQRLYIIIKYWFEIIRSDERKNVKIYNLVLNDIAERPNIQNWAALVKTRFLISVSFTYGWLKVLGSERIFFHFLSKE